MSQADHAAMAGVALIGCAIGYVLVRTRFGFASGYRRLLVERDSGPALAQLLLLAVATVIFTAAFSSGSVGGRAVEPVVMPVGIALATGAFLFGVGMQLASACGSGSLTALGAGNGRMVVVIAFFVAGSFLASLHWAWWQGTPQWPGFALTAALGTGTGMVLQLALIAAIAWRLSRIAAASPGEANAACAEPARPALAPWPMASASVLLPLLSLATLWVAGHPWTITWAHTLAGAKAASLLGWSPAASGYWSLDFPSLALERPLLQDVTTVMDGAIVVGAAIAASRMGAWRPRLDLSRREFMAVAAAGMLMGYGARISSGCNIGAFMVGVASTSAHGWAWLAFALPGNLAGLRLRRWLGAAQSR